MITDIISSLSVILYEGSGSIPVDEKTRLHIVHTVLDHGYKIIVSRDRTYLETYSNKDSLVLGRFTNELSIIGGYADNNPFLYFESIENSDEGQITQILEKYYERIKIKKPGIWKPWFPVIDYGRCTNCLQCLSFCLFDVYGMDADRKIKVQNPAKCKTDCPACSRVCPEIAIIFPKYANSPINGDEVKNDGLQREQVKVDISSLLGGDIYKTLQDRSVNAKSRFSSDRDENKALQERKRYLKELQEMLDIPEEVLRSIPGQEMIETKPKQVREAGSES